MKNHEQTAVRPRPRRLVRTLAAALAAGFAIAAAAQNGDVVARAEALVRAGKYAEAYELLEPLETKLAGDLKFDYLLARAALESGRPSKASFIYERILAVEPNYVGVRLEMGRAYLALGDYARAKLEFETVLRFDGLPPDLREQAQIYARAADEFLAGGRTVGFGYIEYGFGYDSNPLSATSFSEITLTDGTVVPLPISALQRSDHYNALSLGGELVHSLSGGYSLYAGGDARGRQYNNIDVADFQSVDARFGFGFAEGRTNVRLGVIGGYYRQDNTSLRDNYGVNGDVRYLVTNQDQITVSALANRFVYRPDALVVNDFDLYQGSAGWLRAVNNGRGAVGLALIGGYQNATEGRVDGDQAFFGGRLTLQNAFTDRIGAFVLGGMQQGNYRQVNAQFGLTRRDTLYDVTAGVTWSFAPGWSLRPQVIYVKNDSNISLYEFDRTDISVNVRRDF
ncbi:MAG: tetratricopeptide repeat protein [Bacteroidota bacterium]